MSEIRIDIPDDLAAFAETQAKAANMASSSEFLRSLLEKAQRREIAREKLRELLRDDDESVPGIPYTPGMFDHIKERLSRQAEQSDGKVSA